MPKRIIDAYSGRLPATVAPCFANTGVEDPRTLGYVAERGERWGVRIVWLGFDPAGERQRRSRVVSHATASRNGEPFEAVGWDDWRTVVGRRYDEPRRIEVVHDPDVAGAGEWAERAAEQSPAVWERIAARRAGAVRRH